jgi:4a-hydroxytetrahydrobiopterin dehydratase
MAVLAELKCTVCNSGDDPMSKTVIQKNLKKIPDWHLVEEGGTEKLHREFKFPNFSKAANFAIAVAKLAENEGHHPHISMEWGKATIRWWTHKIDGLHRNDFIMAAKTSKIYSNGAYEKVLSEK